MSFLSELFHGHLDWGNLAPQNIFKDTASSFANQPEWAKIAEIALPAIALGGVGLGALGAGAGAAEVGAGAAAEGGLGAAEAAGAGAGAMFADPTEAALLASSYADPTAAALAGGEALPAASAPTALTGSAFDTGFGGTVPYLNDPMAGELSGGLPGQPMTVGTGPTATWADAASMNVGTPGYADPSAITGGAPGGGVTGSPFTGVSDTALDPFAPGSAFTPGSPANIAQTGAPAAPADTSFMGNLKSSFSAFPGQLGKALGNPLTDLGIAGLGYNMLQGYQSQKQLQALQQQETDYQNKIAKAGQASLSAAQPLLAAGQALTTGGPIPAGMQAILDNYRNAQRARVIQSYTSQGLPGDPNKNTSLMQDLNAVDNQVLALQESIGTQMIDTANKMLTSGASATQIAAELPMMMQRLDIALQQQTGNAIANFAAAMSGGTMKVAGQGSGINLNLNSPNTTTTQSLLGAQ